MRHRRGGDTMAPMVFYGVLDIRLGEVVEFFTSRAAAEKFVAECLADEPEWRDILRVEPVEFLASAN